ncbi:alpha/beta hydrolase [Rhodovulum visakhapatnamense]|uniref:AB hydrolase-1 domain-containing protein n=1 Tax=Rhodovulum visakhapatnamense TaxID=364297 RepID=A0ABS1RL48_9RHOB|nr:alpha/beta fold hydrolase [Rhodovulum visakhapatnamense]MBL3571873.1 hypothetical protein [Rhodovulum visakhapatnamense]MBL3579854.1 hypothetical protein [Rhodovulum visakhapatnamense]
MSTPSALWTARSGRDRDDGPVPVVIGCEAVVPVGTVLLVHGRNGAPDQPQIAEIAEAYLARGWRVVAPELPNSIALPASGPADRLTMDGLRRAAAEVMVWTRARWPDVPLALAGHSLGGFAIGHLAADLGDPHHVLGVSPVLSGARLLAARVAMGPPAVAALEREVPLMRAGMEAEDAAPALARVAAPLGVITGAEDGIVPLTDARAYFNAAPNGRFFGALPGQNHCPAGPDVGAMLGVALAALGA